MSVGGENMLKNVPKDENNYPYKKKETWHDVTNRMDGLPADTLELKNDAEDYLDLSIYEDKLDNDLI